MSPVVEIRNFKGLNVLETTELVEPNEADLAENAILGLQDFVAGYSGAVLNRRGLADSATAQSGLCLYLYYSAVLDKWFAQHSSTVYIRPGDLSGSWVAHIALGSNNLIAAVDFGDKAYFVQSGTLGPWSSDGTTATNHNSVAGTTLAVFKNRLWTVDGTHSISPNRVRVFFSNLGIGTTWTTASDFVDIKEKDAEPITAIGGGQGMDVQGRPGLMLFKKNSAYRIYDASTGAYTTIDWSNGCISPHALSTLGTKTYTWGTDDIYQWDGLGPGNAVSKLGSGYFSGLSDVRAARYKQSIIWIPTRGDNVIYELGQAGIVKHTVAGSYKPYAVAPKGLGDKTFLAISDNVSSHRIAEWNASLHGSDLGTTFTTRYRTGWLSFGKLMQLHKIRIFGETGEGGSNTKQLLVYKNWDDSPVETFTIYDEVGNTHRDVIHSLGHGEAFRFEWKVSGGTGITTLEKLLCYFEPRER